jgi:hypothetical protein
VPPLPSARPPRALPPPFATMQPVDAWVEDAGGIWLYDVAPHVVYTIAQGRVTAAQAAALRARGDAFFDRAERCWAIHDWHDMVAYESGARVVMTDWSIARRGRLVGCVILTGSKLVAMGVSAASIPLVFAGVSMEAFTDRPVYEQRAVQVIRGLTG